MEGEVIASRIQFVNSKGPRKHHQDDANDVDVLGGIVSVMGAEPGRTAWIARGNELQIIDMTHSASTCQLKFEEPIMCCTDVDLVSAKDSTLTTTTIVVCSGNSIHVVHPALSRIVKTLSLSALTGCTSLITAVEPLYGKIHGTKDLVLHEEITKFVCPLIVGTEDGAVFIVDLSLDKNKNRVHQLKQTGDSSMDSDDESDDGDASAVTCIRFIPDTQSICVGFQNGMLGMWSIVVLEPEWINVSPDQKQPVVHCCYLFVPGTTHDFSSTGYLWVGQHDDQFLPGEEGDNGTDACITLIECKSSVQKKDDQVSHSVKLHRQTQITLKERGTITKIAALETIHEYRKYINALPEVQESEWIDSSRAVIMWEAEHVHKKSMRQVHLDVFDLSTWINAGKPENWTKLIQTASLHKYPMSNLSTSNPVIGMWIDPFSVFTDQSMGQREAPLPSVSFDVYAITHTSLFTVHFTSPMASGLNEFVTSGAAALPMDWNEQELRRIIQQNIDNGLLDENCETVSLAPVLDLLWEKNLTSVIAHYVTASHRNNLQEIAFDLHDTQPVISWIDSRLEQCWDEFHNVARVYVGETTRSLVPQEISEDRQRMIDISRKILSLRIVIQALATRVVDQYKSPILAKMEREASKRIECIRVVECFIGHGLLPIKSTTIKYSRLAKHWQGLRRSMQGSRVGKKLSTVESVSADMVAKLSTTSDKSEDEPTLFIDRLVRDATADINKSIAKGKAYLKYPMDVKAIVEMFADSNGKMEAMRARHQVVFYFLLDYFLTIPKIPDTNVLNMYAQQFQISPGYQKLVQALWFLDAHRYDRRLMQTAISYLCTSETPEHPYGDDIIRIMWESGHFEEALRMCNVCGCDDPALRMCVLLSNRSLSQALFLQRKHSGDVAQRRRLLYLMFKHSLPGDGVKATGPAMHDVFALPLNKFEEQCLLCFLYNCEHEAKYDLLFIFYALRSRFAEAIALYKEVLERIPSGSGKMDNSKRQELLQSLQHMLPEIQKNIALESLRIAMDKADVKVGGAKTTVNLPMHAVLKQAIASSDALPFVQPPLSNPEKGDVEVIKKLKPKALVRPLPSQTSAAYRPTRIAAPHSRQELQMERRYARERVRVRSMDDDDDYSMRDHEAEEHVGQGELIEKDEEAEMIEDEVLQRHETNESGSRRATADFKAEKWTRQDSRDEDDVLIISSDDDDDEDDDVDEDI